MASCAVPARGELAEPRGSMGNPFSPVGGATRGMKTQSDDEKALGPRSRSAGRMAKHTKVRLTLLPQDGVMQVRPNLLHHGALPSIY